MTDAFRAAVWARWMLTASVFALAIMSAFALYDDRLDDAGLAALCVVALVTTRSVAGLAAAVVAAALGSWVVAGVTAAGALALSWQGLATRVVRRRPPDVEALTAAVAALPDDVLYSVRVAEGTRPLTTRALLDAARHANPNLWRPLLETDPGPDAWDGPVLDLGEGIGQATQFFAEAAGASAEIAARREQPVGSDLLALAACATPLSAAEQWSVDLEQVADGVLGWSLYDLIESQAAFAATSAGGDLDRRVQVGYWARRLAIEDRETAFELGPASLPRELGGLLH